MIAAFKASAVHPIPRYETASALAGGPGDVGGPRQRRRGVSRPFLGAALPGPLATASGRDAVPAIDATPAEPLDVKAG